MSTVTTAVAFVKPIVLEFYANLERSIKNEGTPRFGQVFVRNQIVSFTPEAINEFFGTPDVEDVVVFDDFDVMAKVLSGGIVKKWPGKKEQFLAATLTSLYSILHKLCASNWVPSGNNSVVTQP